ncbi:MAG: hypothetical protein HYY16_04795 [Planctomycetes bacterium]|nr:hypothetical protein [Planctomycetota bacterium]
MRAASVLFFFLACRAAYGQTFHDPGSLVCSQCHTMHNSENGAPVSGVSPSVGLLKESTTDLCLSCHDTAGSNATFSWAGSTPPKVKGTMANELPGGNFSYSAVSPGKGHSPYGSAAFSESTLMVAPGGHYPRVQETCISCHDAHGDDYWSYSFRNLKKITDNCLTCHNIPPGRTPDGTAIASTDLHEAVLVTAGPNADQNNAITSANHNVYRGVNFGAFCGACHWIFHGRDKNDSDVGDGTHWLRHPTGTILPAEYGTNYGATSSAAYPVVTTSGSASRTAEWPIIAAETYVFCLSCHKAHASAFDNAMRWDVSVPQGITGGCGKCHAR